MHVQAREVLTGSDDKSVWVQFLFGDSDAEVEYLLVVRASEFDEQDVRLGMDTYYTELSDQGSSGYGLLKTVRLCDSTFSAETTTTGEKRLGVDTLQIDLDLHPDQVAALHDTMSQVFAGEGCWAASSK